MLSKSRLSMLMLLIVFVAQACQPQTSNRIPLTVNAAEAGAPITLGVPFPQGALSSPDHVKVVDRSGNEIPSQITEVTNWEPADRSIKWVWVFFFADSGNDYFLEYGDQVRRSAYDGESIVVINNQREY